MRRQLTDKGIEKLRPPVTGRLEIFDKIVPALAVRVTPNGAKSFVVRCRVKEQPAPIRITLGDARGMKLTDARQEASDVLRECRAGNDPRETRKAKDDARKAKLEAETRDRENTFAAVAEKFITAHVSKLRSKKHTEAEIRRYLIAPWGERPVSSIDLDDVAGRIQEIMQVAPHMARLVLAHAKTLFRWAAAPARPRELRIKVNPCAVLSAKKDFDFKPPSRTVTIGPDHLRLIWRAAGELGGPFGPYVKMLLLSGQRRSEVADMTWSELDLVRDKVWNIPAERMKAGRPHEVPLSAGMIELLTKLQANRGKGEFVFSTTLGKKPISGFSKFKVELDKKVAERRADELKETHGSKASKVSALPQWRLHDARRTVRTGLSAIGSIPHDVCELVIAHVPAPLVATYDQHTYRPEKRQALELWAQKLKSIVEPPPADDKIVELHRKPVRAKRASAARD